MLPMEAGIAYQRHLEMLREAEQIRLANQAMRHNAQPSLLSRIQKLLTGSHQTKTQVQTHRPLTHRA